MLNKLIRFYAGGMVPEEHLRIRLPENANIRFFMRLYCRTWLIHPIKRRIAKYYLVLLRRLFGLKVIGITGSAGKTTTKEMLASILGLEGSTVYSYANIDPVFNIPTTILKCTPVTKYLVLEMGVEYPGEMDYYLWLAKPDIGIVTNVFPTHTLYFGNERGVFEEKSKLVLHLSKESWAILNGNNMWLRTLKGKLKCKTVWVKKRVELNALNSELAKKAAKVLKISDAKIKKGVASFEPQEHRMKLIKHKSGALIVDDSYNSNPKAVEAVLKAFNKQFKNKKRIMVLGDMLELGNLEKKMHRKIGAILMKYKPEKVIFVGSAMKNAFNAFGSKNAIWVKTSDQALKPLKAYLKPNFAILIKASRSVGLDDLLNSL